MHDHRRTTFLETLRGASGAIDLASIIVGVIVTGILAGTIAATVFAVIPWAQDSAAKTNLESVRLAEGVIQVQSKKFKPMSDLVTAKLVRDSATVSAVTDADGTCFIAASASKSGNIFFQTSKSPTSTKYVAGMSTADSDWCLPLSTAIDALSGTTAPPAAVGTSFDRLTAAQTAYRASNGQYSNDVAALESFTGTKILAPGESVKILRSVLPTYKNLFVDGSLEAVEAPARFTGGSAGSTFVAGTDGGADGSRYVRMTQAVAGDLTTTKRIILAATPVSPAQGTLTHPQQNSLNASGYYTLSAKLRTSVASLAGLKLQAQFFNGAGTSLAIRDTSRTVTATSGSWTQVGGNIANIPATATSMKILLSTTNWVGAGVKVDIDSLSITSEQHNFTSSDLAKPERFGFPEWSDERPGGYLGIIRGADGAAAAVTSRVPAPFAFFNNQWTTSTDGFMVATGSDFPVTTDAVNGLPIWALNEGITVNDDTWWTLKDQAWLVK